MLLRLVTLLTLSATLFAANIRLYLTDGDYQMATEYQVLEDRVRYFSAERNQWEQLPLDLVDLKRTIAEAKEREEELHAEIEAQQAEEDALRRQREEIARVPVNHGVYYIDGEELVPIEPDKIEMEESATRKILQILAPGPIVAGKVTVYAEGGEAAFRVTSRRPEFYFRLQFNERFDLVKLDAKDDERKVEAIDVLPEEQGVFETLDTVETFKQQMQPRLYRIWSQQDLEPGEYALVEYTEGEMNIQVWSFGVD